MSSQTTDMPALTVFQGKRSDRRVMGEEGILTMPGNSTAATATATASSSNSSTTTASTTAGPNQNHHQSGPLKCPRCDSTNTKFCYYNNYSLAQPRHFCKACKRYWTRGGTLRNVPVGGGCRKNKRVKKTPTPSASSATASDPPALPIPTQMNVRPTHLNPLFYDMSNLTFPRLDPTLHNSNISLPCTTSDLQPQLNVLGLGFPPNHHQNNEEYQFGFSTHLSHLQQSLFHDYPLFGSAPAASHLVSRLKQSKTVDSLLHYDDLQASANGNLGLMKEVKLEGEANAIGYCENQFAAMTATTAAAASTGQADSSFLYWNATAWPDATNCGSSVAPLF